MFQEKLFFSYEFSISFYFPLFQHFLAFLIIFNLLVLCTLFWCLEHPSTPSPFLPTQKESFHPCPLSSAAYEERFGTGNESLSTLRDCFQRISVSSIFSSVTVLLQFFIIIILSLVLFVLYLVIFLMPFVLQKSTTWAVDNKSPFGQLSKCGGD